MTDITVVIPAFEARRFVGAAVESALTQQPAPDAVVVVDDGSTDGTGGWVEANFPEVELVRTPHRGEAAARNAGLRAADTTWVAFLDADDRFLPGRLAAVIELLAQAPELDAVTTDAFMEVNGQIRGTCYGPGYRFQPAEQHIEILRQNFIFGHVVARRERLLELGGFDETIRHTADWAMWCDLLLAGGRVGFVDRPLSVYRVHAASASADQTRMHEGTLATLHRTARRTDLSNRQRRMLASSIAGTERRSVRSQAEAALLDGSADVRRLATQVATETENELVVRIRAGAAVVAPRAACAVQRRRRRGRVVATAGWLVPAVDEAIDPATAARAAPPLVSIVLPFLNEARFLAGAIETVRQQTMGAWELILVDDGSSDGSGLLAEKATEEDPARITVLRHPEGRNEGLAASRNLGLGRARAETTAFLDADDRWDPAKLERQLRSLAEHPDAVMVAGPTRHRFLDTDHPDEIFPIGRISGLLPRGRFARELVRERLIMPPPPSSVLYRTSALRGAGGVPPGNSTYEDQRTYVAMSLAGPTMITEDVVATYARRNDSLYGRLADDNFTKAQQRREFEWWVVQRMLRRHLGSAVALSVLLSLTLHRCRIAFLRRLRRNQAGSALRPDPRSSVPGKDVPRQERSA